MDDLPDLVFEKMFSYLSLEDLIRFRGISRRWYKLINSFKVKSLCFSNQKRNFIIDKILRNGDAFAQCFINSTSLESFLNQFATSILSHIKRLCVCKLNKENLMVLVHSLNTSLGQLEELGIFGFDETHSRSQGTNLELNLPMLKSIWIRNSRGIGTLTLDAARLKSIEITHCMVGLDYTLRLNLVHEESVERLIISASLHAVHEHLVVKNLKSLKYLYLKSSYFRIDPLLLYSLKQLQEIYLNGSWLVSDIFKQKQRYNRADLKILMEN